MSFNNYTKNYTEEEIKNPDVIRDLKEIIEYQFDQCFMAEQKLIEEDKFNDRMRGRMTSGFISHISTTLFGKFWDFVVNNKMNKFMPILSNVDVINNYSERFNAEELGGNDVENVAKGVEAEKLNEADFEETEEEKEEHHVVVIITDKKQNPVDKFNLD